MLWGRMDTALSMVVLMMAIMCSMTINKQCQTCLKSLEMTFKHAKDFN
jgi:hypothetical protein